MIRTKKQILAELSDAIRENSGKGTTTVKISLLIEAFNMIIQGVQELHMPDIDLLEDSEETNGF